MTMQHKQNKLKKSRRLCNLLELVSIFFVTSLSVSLHNLLDFYISNQITDADEACRSSEISVDLIIIIVFL